MIPNFFIFNKEISVYMIMALAGVLSAGVFVYRYAEKMKIDSIEMIYLSLTVGLGGVIGSHILYGITNIRYIIKLSKNLHLIDSFQVFVDQILYIFGGSVYYGGLIVGIIAGFTYARYKKLETGPYADILTTSLPLFHGFGRIGCFLSGCCFGVECRVGFIYKHSLIEIANGVRRFPIQLVESALNFMLFGIFFYFLKKSLFKGKLLYIYLCSYSVIRFILEFWRGDDIRGFIFSMSTSQFISIILFFVGLIMLIKTSRKEAEINSEI